MRILTLLPILILIGCSNESKIEKIDGSEIKKEQLTEKIKSLMESADVNGLAVSILNNNESVYKETFGYRNWSTKDTLKSNSIFYGASLSKAVFAVLVMQLVEEGKINLDTPIQNYLDKPLTEYEFKRDWEGYKDLRDDRRYENITARMCLSHTTGLPNWRFLTKNGFDIEGKLHFLYEPGTHYNYSGEGISLLQFVVEKIVGKGLEEMAQEKIFRPLEMKRTSYIYVQKEKFKNQYVYGNSKNQKMIPFDKADDAGAAGSLSTTLDDYSIFLEAILKYELISKHSSDEMFDKQISITSKQQFGPNALVETSENEDIGLGYGLGWGLLETLYGFGAFKEGHSEGFQHYSIVFPEKQIGLVVLSNSDNGESIFKELLEIGIGDNYTPWKWENYIPYQRNL